MDLVIDTEPLDRLEEHARVPIAFTVDRVLDLTVEDGGFGGFRLREREVEPWLKDYDAIDGNRPTGWPDHFDVSSWGLIAARIDGRYVGGAVLAFRTEGCVMLEGRSDLAVLWDLRVSPELRGRSIAAALFAAAEHWAAARMCRQLKVETQNVNVGACRFYARLGCELGAVNRFAYPELPDEVQLLWYKDLVPGRAAGAP
jgi:GNAT superfamily N-acetyltransferase